MNAAESQNVRLGRARTRPRLYTTLDNRFADPPDVAWSRPATCGGGRMQLVQEVWLGGVSYQDSARVLLVLAGVFTPLCAFAGGLVG